MSIETILNTAISKVESALLKRGYSKGDDLKQDVFRRTIRSILTDLELSLAFVSNVEDMMKGTFKIIKVRERNQATTLKHF